MADMEKAIKITERIVKVAEKIENIPRLSLALETLANTSETSEVALATAKHALKYKKCMTTRQPLSPSHVVDLSAKLAGLVEDLAADCKTVRAHTPKLQPAL